MAPPSKELQPLLLNGENVPAETGSKPLGIVGGVANLTNTILGVGTMAMPYALMLCGVSVFTALMLGVCLAAKTAVGLLFKSVEALELKDPRYPTLGRATYGLVGEQVASWAVTLQQFGACIAYTVVIADLLQPILSISGAGFFEDRWPLQIVVVVCVVFPLCMLPTLDSLKFVSTTSITLIMVVVLITVVNGIYILSDDDSAALRRKLELEHDHELHPHRNMTNSTLSRASDKMALFPEGLNFLSALPIISFSFLCHQNSFPIYVELDPEFKNAESMERIATYSMAICFMTYMMSAFFGYVTFVSYTESNLILNFPVENSYIAIPMDIARVGFGISFILSFPLMVWEARHNIDTLAFGKRPFSWRRHFLVTAFVVGLSCTTGIVAGNIGIVLELVGSTCSPTMVYILPGLFYIKAVPGPTFSRKKLPAVLLVALGCVLVPICLVMWVFRYIICTGSHDGEPMCITLGITDQLHDYSSTTTAMSHSVG